MFCSTCGTQLLDRAVVCPGCGTGTVNFHAAEPRIGEVSCGTIAVAYVVGAAIPLIGWIMAVYLLGKSKAGHAMGVGAVSLAMFFVWLGLLTAQNRGGYHPEAASLRAIRPANVSLPRRPTGSPSPTLTGRADDALVPSAADLVGVWHSEVVEFGRPMTITWVMAADGTSSYQFDTVLGTTFEFGTWQYSDGVVFERWSNGLSGRGAIQWLGHDAFVLTILDNGVPAYTGVKRHYHRQ